MRAGIAAALAAVFLAASTAHAQPPLEANGVAEVAVTDTPARSSPPQAAAPRRDQPPPDPRHRHYKKPSLAQKLEWRWPKFQLYQLGLTIGQGVIAVGSIAIPSFESWKSPNAFDEAARDALRFENRDDARRARDASDVGLVLLLNQNLVDSTFVTWWYHNRGSTALQMSLINVQTISFSASLNALLTTFFGRERPYGRSLCYAGEEAETSDCLSGNRYRSFFSGHSTAAFTLASLTCVHHINLPLYGGGAVEAIPCAASMLVATGVGLLRVAADQHYMSDVLMGAAVGTASGFAIPYLFHYAHANGDDNPALKAAGVEGLTVLPTAGGLQMTGIF